MVLTAPGGRTALALCALAAWPAAVQAQALIHRVGGSASNERQGAAVALVGDVDGDGREDFAIGAPFANAGLGRVRVHSGADASVLWDLPGSSSGGRFGSSVAALDDLDGDGRRELAIGAHLGSAPGAIGCGLVRVVSGSSGATRFERRGDSTGDHMGWSVANAGDVDGDGIGDVIGGAPDDDDLGESTGSARIWSGATGAPIRTIVGAAPRELFGYAVAGGADLDGDGRRDVVVGGPYFTTVVQNGVVRAHSGTTGAVLWSSSGDAVRETLGSSIALVGDVDGDGRSDVLAGARQPSSGGGYARLVSGATGATLRRIDAGASQRLFGAAVAPAGDVDYDGVPDYAIGAPDSNDAGTLAGVVRLVAGADGSTLHEYAGIASARFGSSLAGGADISGEGGPDLVVGAPLEPTGGPQTGAAYAFRGSDVPPPDPHDPLEADVTEVSYRGGGVQRLTLRAGPEHAGRRFVMLGSLSGTEPGFALGGVHVPLVPDRYLRANLALHWFSPLVPVHGVLDASGEGMTEFRAERLHGVGFWAGRTLHHAYVVVDPPRNVVFASNAVAVTIVP